MIPEVRAHNANKVRVHGHRGCRGYFPENSLRGFEEALNLGAHTLEMDVVSMSDGRMLVSHEPYFLGEICRDPSGQNIPDNTALLHNIYRMTAGEVSGYSCGMDPHPRFPHQRQCPAPKPLLSEVCNHLRAFCTRLNRALPPLNIEIKSRPEWDGEFHPAPAEYAERFIHDWERIGYPLSPIIQSFDVRVLESLRVIKPALQLVLLVEDELPVLDACLARLSFTPWGFSPHHRLITPELVRKCREAGMRLIAWTVNQEEDMQRLLEWGVEDLITDYPDRAVKVAAACISH